MAEWLDLGKHGGYILGSFGVSALFMIVEVILVMRRKKTLLQRMGRMVRMNSEVEQ